MIPGPFDYLRPRNLSDAIAALSANGEGAKVIAGGHSLLPMMKLRFVQPTLLIDINPLDELKGITFGPSEVTIGATTTHSTLEFNREIAKTFPLMAIMAPL